MHPLILDINGTTITCENSAKYLRMTIDTKHVKKEIKYRQLYCLLWRKSKLSMHNKILIRFLNQYDSMVYNFGVTPKVIETSQNKVRLVSRSREGRD